MPLETKLEQAGTVLKNRRIVDLSLLLTDQLPSTWPGHMPFQHHVWKWFAAATAPWGQVSQGPSHYQTRYIILDEHSSTHFDAPTHYVPPPGSDLPLAGDLGLESGDKVPLSELQGPCAVFDVRDHRGETDGVSPLITTDHLEAWEAEHGRLEAGEVLLLLTGWDRYFVEGPEGLKYGLRPAIRHDFPGWPAPTAELVSLLVERGVKTLGIDTPSIGAVQDPRPAHEAGLLHGTRFVEGLANLHELPTRGSYFVFLPLKIKNSTGGPGRAIAYV